jgi:hypothetical protein
MTMCDYRLNTTGLTEREIELTHQLIEYQEEWDTSVVRDLLSHPVFAPCAIEHCKYADLQAEIAKLTKEKDALRSALKQFGQHRNNCGRMVWRHGWVEWDGDCTCGLSATLATGEDQ